jgi:hypothetical protein
MAWRRGSRSPRQSRRCGSAIGDEQVAGFVAAHETCFSVKPGGDQFAGPTSLGCWPSPWRGIVAVSLLFALIAPGRALAMHG